MIGALRRRRTLQNILIGHRIGSSRMRFVLIRFIYCSKEGRASARSAMTLQHSASFSARRRSVTIRSKKFRTRERLVGSIILTQEDAVRLIASTLFPYRKMRLSR